MRSKTSYFLVAILTFVAGWGAFQALKLVDFMEEHLANCYTPVLEASTYDCILTDPTDANEIYRTIVNVMFANKDTKLVVLDAQTVDLVGLFGSVEDDTSSIIASFPTIDPATIASYENCNSVSTNLVVSNLGVHHVLITRQDFHEMFSESESRRGWPRFYKKYPGSPGLVFFSNIGFNMRRTEALVYAGRTCDYLCGSGSFVLLRKQNGAWTIVAEQVIWVS